MKKQKYPIIANGEKYVEPIMKKMNFFPKDMPHTYEEAKVQMITDLNLIQKQISDQTEIFLEEKVICVRLEPKFEAKSYMPEMLMISDDMKIIGGRKYSYVQSDGEIGKAKLYFVRTKDRGIDSLKHVLEQGTRDTVKSWQKTVQSIKAIDLLDYSEKVQGLKDDWESGSVEVVLHPLDVDREKLLSSFVQTAGIKESFMKIKSYEDGLVFINAICNRDNLDAIKGFNALRTVHPMGTVEIDPYRSMQEVDGPKPAKLKMCSEVKVGMFDGGINENISLLKGYSKSFDVVKTDATVNSIRHGNGVCGAILHGHLGGKLSNDELENPIISVDSFRVLPGNVNTGEDPEAVLGMYDTIDIIENVVLERKDLKLYNISFGPRGPILDDNISRFTYALDRLTYKVEEDEANPLFCVAVGNDGDQGEYLDRIQSPSDMVNGLAVGAYSYTPLNEKARASYSCIGPGREGAKTKPDILEFGGSPDRPFITVGYNEGKIGATAGTSFSTPIATGKIGRLMARSRSIVPHMGRSLLIHNAKCENGIRNCEIGYGYSQDDLDEILKCDDKKVTILYSGDLPASNTVKLPIFAPAISGSKGNVKVTWTISTIVNPDITDTDAYTNNCIEDTFHPNSSIFNFSKKGQKTIPVNIAEEGSAKLIRDLMEAGYKMSDLAASTSPKTNKSEAALRNKDLKWDTIIKKDKSMRSSSLMNPFLTLHAMGRNGYEKETIRYFVVVTIEAPKYDGSLYDNILQTYPNLVPIEVQNVNRILQPVV